MASRFRIRALIAALAACSATLWLLSASASAEAPLNDNFADQDVIATALPQTVTGTTAESTIEEPDEPDHDDSEFIDTVGSVWYGWSSGANPPEHVKLSVCPSELGPLPGIAIYQGDSLPELVLVGRGGCDLIFSPAPETAYGIAIFKHNTAFVGPFELRLRQIDPPPNDDFADASPIPLGGSVTGTTELATIEDSEPHHPPFPPPPEMTASVWYAWDAGAARPEHVRLDVCNSGQQITVYEGSSLDALTPVTDEFGCEATFSPQPGSSYRVAVYAAFGPLGSFELRLRALAPPANDDFEDATTIPAALPQVVSGTTVDATREAGEPDLPGGGGSVWYSWTPTAPVRAKVDICHPEGVPRPAVIVYTGASIASLSEVARSNGFLDCTVSFNAGASTTYRIAVDGGRDAFEFTLRRLQPPPNDDLAAAQPITGSLPQQVDGTLLDATHEPGEPTHGGGGGPIPDFPDGSVWYAWTAPAGGEVVIDACDWFSGGFTIAVYTGSSYEGADELQDAAANDGGCRQVFAASASTTYRIAVDSSREVPFSFEIRALHRPDNDDLGAAEVLDPGVPQEAPGTTVDATSEDGEPGHGGWRSSVWYQWNSGDASEVSLDACRDEPVMVLAVYTGTDYSNLSPVVGPNSRCRQRFTPAPNTDYLIVVDSQVVQAPFTLRLRETQPPPNDAFAAAVPLTGGGPLAIAGTNFDATTEPGEPGHGSPFAERASVWYAWTAPPEPATRTVSIDTCDSDFQARLNVYTGTEVGALTEQQADRTFCDESSFPSGDRATFTSVANQVYLIRVAGIAEQDDEGEFTLQLAFESTPPPPPPTTSTGSTAPLAPTVAPRRKKCKKGKKLKKGKCVKRCKKGSKLKKVKKRGKKTKKKCVKVGRKKKR